MSRSLAHELEAATLPLYAEAALIKGELSLYCDPTTGTLSEDLSTAAVIEVFDLQNQLVAITLEICDIVLTIVNHSTKEGNN